MRVLRWRAVVVAGESMTPTLQPGDCLLVRARARVRVGDLALARRPGACWGGVAESAAGLLLVKRVAGRVEGGWWLLSDNPAAGLDDSRVFGAVPDAGIVGRVVLRYYPWARGRVRGRRRRSGR